MTNDGGFVDSGCIEYANNPVCQSFDTRQWRTFRTSVAWQVYGQYVAFVTHEITGRQYPDGVILPRSMDKYDRG
jgi:hypothetical protein